MGKTFIIPWAIPSPSEKCKKTLLRKISLFSFTLLNICPGMLTQEIICKCINYKCKFHL